MSNGYGKPRFAGEPAVIIGAVATVVVFVLANFDVVVDATTIEALILSAVTLISAIATRENVSPVVD